MTPEEQAWAIAREHIFLPPGQNEFDSGRGELAEDIAKAIREAVAAMQKACARAAKRHKPSGEIVTSWGMQESEPCTCPRQIAEEIQALGQLP